MVYHMVDDVLDLLPHGISRNGTPWYTTCLTALGYSVISTTWYTMWYTMLWYTMIVHHGIPRGL